MCVEDTFLASLQPGEDPHWSHQWWREKGWWEMRWVKAVLGSATTKREFSILKEVRREVSRTASLTSGELSLAGLGLGWESSLGGSPDGQSCPGRLDNLQEENSKDREIGHSNAPEERRGRRLTEESLGWSSGKKTGEFRTFGRKGRKLRRTTRM